jgi:hypothetical protein
MLEQDVSRMIDVTKENEIREERNALTGQREFRAAAQNASSP